MENNSIKNITRLLGGHTEIAIITDRDISRVYRWCESGELPVKIMKKIIDEACNRDIELSTIDFFDSNRLDRHFEIVDSENDSEKK